MDNNKSSNLEKRPNLKIFLNFLKQKCKLTNPSYEVEEEIVIETPTDKSQAEFYKDLIEGYKLMLEIET